MTIPRKFFIWLILFVFLPWPLNFIVYAFGIFWVCYKLVKWGWND